MTKAMHFAASLNGIAIDEEMIRELLAEAAKASHKAYAPYSNFLVGCIIVLKNGDRFLGANIENASYPVTICAERTAISQVVLNGLHHEIALVVIVTQAEQPASPCGMCRQFLSEFLSADTPIIYGTRAGRFEISSMKELLPCAFNRFALEK